MDGLPPRGGSGLKSERHERPIKNEASPSARREWVEMIITKRATHGLQSPSARREWVEITRDLFSERRAAVSLREEGVG